MIESFDLKSYAQGLGLLGIGVAEAGEPPHLAAYREWLAAGRHGQMEYLNRHADLKSHPHHLLENCRSVIAASLGYRQPNPGRPGYPRIARYALGRDYHRVLRSKLRTLQNRLAKAFPEAHWRICVDSAPLMERDFAQLAGLGWYGKNTCLIDSHAGSWFVLGFLLTDLVLAPDVPAVGGCGTCRKCVDACPTGAIAFLEGRWQVVGSRCISYLTIENRGPLPTDLEAGIGDWTFGCDVCQEVCPFNQPRPTQPLRACDTNEADFLATRQWPSLLELAQIDYADWDHLTRSSPVRRTGWEGLRRNAAINLKNQVGG